MSDYTQKMTDGKSFPTKLSPAGNGEVGDEGINTNAPYGDKKLVPAGKFVQTQLHKGTELDHVVPAETTIRNVRTADLGPEFGRGAVDSSIEIAGEKRSLPKKFLIGGKVD
jgi:hypothetical protein